MGYSKDILERSLCDFEWTIIQLPILVKIPLRDNYRLRCIMRKRSLLLHVMLRQGTSWHALDKMEYLLPPLHLDESEIY